MRNLFIAHRLIYVQTHSLGVLSSVLTVIFEKLPGMIPFASSTYQSSIRILTAVKSRGAGKVTYHEKRSKNCKFLLLPKIRLQILSFIQRRFGPETFRYRHISVPARFGHGTFRSLYVSARDISTPERFGPESFRYSDISAWYISALGHFNLGTLRPGRKYFQTL